MFAPNPRSHDEVDVNAGTGGTESIDPKGALLFGISKILINIEVKSPFGGFRGLKT